MNSSQHFTSQEYSLITNARLNHLESLNLPLNNLSSLEVGAGIGDFTEFLLKKNCTVDSTDAREDLVQHIKNRFSEDKRVNAFLLDMENPKTTKKYDIVFCYGLLYHLKNAEQAIDFMASVCKKFLILETCVSVNKNNHLNHISEDAKNPTQSIYGLGCRPDRKWLFQYLNGHFKFVYMPYKQPSHPQFPVKWDNINPANNNRSIYICSHEKIENELLNQGFLEKHI